MAAWTIVTTVQQQQLVVLPSVCVTNVSQLMCAAGTYQEPPPDAEDLMTPDAIAAYAQVSCLLLCSLALLPVGLWAMIDSVGFPRCQAAVAARGSFSPPNSPG